MGKNIIETWHCACDMCGHEWNTRTFSLPNLCPGCKTCKWDRNPNVSFGRARKQPPPNPIPVMQNNSTIETDAMPGDLDASIDYGADFGA